VGLGRREVATKSHKKGKRQARRCPARVKGGVTGKGSENGGAEGVGTTQVKGERKE